MAKIYDVNEKIGVKVDDIVIHISPLKYKDKAEIQSLIMDGKPMDAAVYAIKKSIKSVTGLEKSDGSVYELKLEDNMLTDDTVDNLLNIKQSTKLNILALQLLNGIPDQFTDPQTGKKLSGVEFITEESNPEKKSKTKAGA